MVTDSLRKSRRPVVDVDVFKLERPLFDSVGNESVVELFRVLVKHIAVSLDCGDTGGLVDVGEDIGQRLVNSTCLKEFVEVASYDDVRLFICRQDRLDEGLRGFVSYSASLNTSKNLQQQD